MHEQHQLNETNIHNEPKHKNQIIARKQTTHYISDAIAWLFLQPHRQTNMNYKSIKMKQKFNELIYSEKSPILKCHKNSANATDKICAEKEEEEAKQNNDQKVNDIHLIVEHVFGFT